MDEEPRRRYTNGSISSELGTRLLQSLSETNIDRWGDDERRDMRRNLEWVSDRRKSESTRRRLITLALGIGIPLFGAAGAWYGASNAKPSPCPSGYICTVTPLRTPSP